MCITAGITTAALQFNARAYPAIVPSGDMVKVKVHGADPDGAKVARGDRIAAHMSWQLSRRGSRSGRKRPTSCW